MRIPEGYNLVLDLSYYQGPLKYELLPSELKGIIARASFGTWKDPMFRTRVKNAQDKGKVVAAYTWFRPDQSTGAQIDTVCEQCYGLDIKILYSDQEQHGKTYLNLPPIYSPDTLSSRGKAHITGLMTRGFKVGTYTRSTWVDSYMRPAIYGSGVTLPWLYDYPLWMASYPYASGRIAISWYDLLTKYAPTIFSPYTVQGWPRKNPVADIWQWSGDKFILPGIEDPNGKPIAVDLNYVSDKMLQMFGDVPTTPPVVTPPPDPDENPCYFEVVSYELNVRSYPAIADNKIGKKYKGDKIPIRNIQILNSKSVWVEFEKDKWCALVHDGIQYCKNI